MRRWGNLIGAFFVAGCGAPEPVSVPGQVFIATQGGTSFKLPLVDIYVFDGDSVARVLAARDAVDSALRVGLAARAESAWTDLTAERAKYEAAGLRTGYAACDQAEWAPDFIAEYPGVAAGYRRICNRVRSQWTAARLPLRLREWRYTAIRDSLVRYGVPFYLDGLGHVATVKTGADGEFAVPLVPGKRYAIGATAQRHAGGEIETYRWLVWHTPSKDGPPTPIQLMNQNQFLSGDSADVLRHRAAEPPSAEFWQAQAKDAAYYPTTFIHEYSRFQ